MFRGRGSGRGQRGGRSQGRSGNGGGRTCRFFASAAGCSKGASCSFSHDSNGGGKKRSQPTNSPPSAGPPQQHQQNKQQKKKQEKRKSKRKNNNSGGSSGGSGGRGCRGSASTTNDDDSESGHTVPQIPGCASFSLLLYSPNTPSSLVLLVYVLTASFFLFFNFSLTFPNECCSAGSIMTTKGKNVTI